MYHEFVDNIHYHVFDDVTDLVETVKKVPHYNHRGYVGDNSIGKPSVTGRQLHSWEQVYEAAFQPWEDGMQVVDRMVRKLESVDLPKPKSRKRKMRFDEADGDELDLDRLRDGQPFWRKSKRDLLSGPQTVTIVIDLGALADVDHQDILWRGAAAIAMTHILEDAGFRVELWSIHCARNVGEDGSTTCNAVCLKRPSNPLDAGTLVSAVSAWFYRTLMFAAKAISERLASRWLGVSRLPYSDDVQRVTGVDNAILVAGTYSEWGAISIAEESLKTLAGVKVVEEPYIPPEELEQVQVAVPAEPPKPLTKAELARQRADKRRADREYKKWAKEWAAKQRDA